MRVGIKIRFSTRGITCDCYPDITSLNGINEIVKKLMLRFFAQHWRARIFSGKPVLIGEQFENY